VPHHTQGDQCEDEDRHDKIRNRHAIILSEHKFYVKINRAFCNEIVADVELPKLLRVLLVATNEHHAQTNFHHASPTRRPYPKTVKKAGCRNVKNEEKP
jgi:hypothetical protein